MLPVSTAFREAIAADTRRIFGRVTVDYTDPFMDQSITVSANEQLNTAFLPQVADAVSTPLRRWASADGSTLADGLSFPAPVVPIDGQVGWWATQLAGAGGAFATPFPTLTVSFTSRPILTLRVTGDSARGEFPVDFEIRLLGAGGVLRHTRTVTGNTLADWQETIAPVTEVTQCILEVRRWSHTGRQSKILEFFTSIQETYEGDSIIDFGLFEERELAQHSLPVGNVSANEITLRLDNSTRKFDAGNRQSPLYQLLKQNRRIRAWLGAELTPGGAIEYVPLGTFWSGEWHAKQETVYASTTGRDRLELLRKSTYDAAQVLNNQTLHALATTILQNAGLAASEFWVDPALQGITVPHAWFVTVSHREALRQIAEAALGQVYADRNGVIRVEGSAYLLGQETFVSPWGASAQSTTITPHNYFRKDTPVKWGELANRIEVETQPLQPVATLQEVFRSNAPVAIAAGQTMTMTVRYNEPPVIDAAISLINHDPWLSGYTRRRRITIDRTRIDAPLTDFPVFVRLRNTNFDFSQSMANGHDIRFTAADGTTLLSYERERHDQAGQMAEYHVRIPSVSNTADTVFFMYFRTDTTADGANPTAVWDSNTMGRWALNENPAGTAPQMRDSTVNANHGTTQGAMTAGQSVEGQVGKGSNFDGTNDYVHVHNSNSVNVTGDITISQWIFPQSHTINHIPLHKDFQYSWLIRQSDRFVSWADSSNWSYDAFGYFNIGLVLDAWQHITIHKNGSTVRFYRNGVEALARTNFGGAITGTTNPAAIGAYLIPPTSASNHVRGNLDEVRISNIARSAAWIRADFNSGNNTLLNVGVVEILPAITATTFYAWGADVTVSSPTNAGTFTLVINGRPLRILNRERAIAEDATSITDHGLLRYEFPHNHLVQTLSQAQTIATTLLRLYRHPRRDLTMEWRGNPALTLGDVIITPEHGQWLRYWVTKQEISYDGALSANLEGRMMK